MKDAVWYTFPMRRPLKYALWGFLFGTFGLYALAALSLMSPIIEMIVVPFLYPGRWLAEIIAGSEGTTGDVIVLALFNGILYALLFMLIRVIAKKTTGA